MRILHVITGMARAAGTSVFCGEALRALSDQGHDCRLWVRRHNPADAYPTGAAAVSEGPPEADWRPDVVHLHALWTPWLLRPYLWAKRRGIPVVWSPHGMLAPWAMAHKHWKKILPWRLYQRAALRGAALLHTTSAQETRWVRALGFHNPIAEVPLGTTLPDDVPPFAERRRLVLFVGRIYPVKGLDLLIKAWARLKRQGKAGAWHVLCVGPDQAGHMGELEALARQVGVTTQRAPLAEAEQADLSFTGPLYGEDKDAAYRAARAAILPSYTENFGGVVPDALAFGLPVFASQATPWGVLEEARCGATFAVDETALSEALADLLAQPDEALQAMGERGRALVRERYAWPAVARALAAAYRDIPPCRVP